MDKIFTLLFTLSLFSTTVFAEEQECSDRYRAKVFKQIGMEGNVLFGHSKGLSGENIPLHYDVYFPKNDTASLRPLVVLWHGGAFLDMFKKTSPDIVALCKDLARMGYVTISPDYRGIRDFTDFFERKDLVKEVVKAAIDGNKALCHIVDQIDNHGNPFRIDKNAIFGGGVSGGAVLGIHLILLNSTDDLNENFRRWAKEVDDSMIDEILENKYCGTPDVMKGFFNISGAVIDTSFIQKSNTGFVHFHGTKDDIVPYNVGKPLMGLTAAPTMYGSKPIHDRLEELDSYSKLYSYKGLGHVPFLNLDLFQLLMQVNVINEEVYYETLDAMTEFMFPRISCEPVPDAPTGIFSNNTVEMNFYPNPASGSFQINMPENNLWQIKIFDFSGKILLQNQFQGSNYSQNITYLPKGMFFIQITSPELTDKIYTGKITRI